MSSISNQPRRFARKTASLAFAFGLLAAPLLFAAAATAQTTAPPSAQAPVAATSPAAPAGPQAPAPVPVAAVPPAAASVGPPKPPAYDHGDTAWMLTSTALVLMMTIPGLALFYAGMVRKKNILATVMQSFAICCLVTIVWTVVGYSLAFTNGSGATAP